MADATTTIKLLDFWAPWCQPCKIMNPIIDELEKEYAGKFEVVRINVDEDAAMSGQYGVMSIPTYVVMKGEVEVGRKIGVTAKTDLVKMIIG